MSPKFAPDVIELGVPFSDPLADGPTIQMASCVALENGVTLDTCFDVLEESRKKGLTVPVIFMGYYNPFYQYGEERCVQRMKEAGGNGFIIVDLPLGEESDDFVSFCHTNKISVIPLIAPTTTTKRMKTIVKKATGFIYCVALSGVTGSRTELPADLKNYIERVKSVNENNVPLAVGFGISTREHFLQVSEVAEGVVIGSAIIKTLKSAQENNSSLAEAVQSYAASIVGK
uniref:tryptophan synthase n=1 Tax=Vannella robusta TaxID=1487602 RepID=A0A7S4HLK9_9EUKA